MSKITSKNLHYDDTLPPFLARMRANENTSDGRHEYTVARPKKARTAEDEAEDEPVYFDEGSGETLTKSEWEKKEEEEGKKEENEVKQIEGREEGDGGKEGKEKEKVAAIGASRKRKAGKVVGGEDEEENEDRGKKVTAAKQTSVKKAEKSKPAKKGKKIKLSFGDDE
ncbi:hypothetical protein VTL71DRAFT_666 [Oculimacula yallundae]|uniref:DUF4604 domain-containing protein n=1 Tax=Oculimacula yallundae TaxID=86028 RepID=A0ABR4D0P8_9HELO